MHPSLWTLIRLYNRASFRKLARGARTFRGAVMLLFVVGGLGVALASTVGLTIFLASRPDFWEALRDVLPRGARPDRGAVETYLPLFLLAPSLKVLLDGRGEGLLYFTPAEVAFLFAGPFRRRDLLLFKLYRSGVAILAGSALLASSPLVFLFRGWMQAFVGIALSLAFVNLLSLAGTLARLMVAEAAHTRARRAVLLVVGTLAAIALPRGFAHGRLRPVFDLVAGFRSTWAGAALLAPFEAFSNVLLAGRWFPELVGWAAVAAAIDAGLLALVLKLDSHYLEWSADVSQRLYERLQRMQRGAGVALPRKGRPAAIPPLPWLAGAGPVAWRQLLITGRRCRGAIRMALAFVAGILFWNWAVSGSLPALAIPSAGVVGLFGYVTYLFGTMIPVAFRADAEHLDVLKSLPVGPMALTVGELGGAVAFISGVQILSFGVYGLATWSGGGMLVAAAILAPAVNWVMLASGSLFFLLYPVPTTPGASRDMHVASRAAWSLVLQTLAQIPLMGIPALAGAAAFVFGRFSWPALITTALAALVLEAVPMTMLAAWAYDRSDPSVDPAA